MKKTLSKILVFAMVLALATSLAAVSAFAFDYTAINGTTTSFNKNLVVDSTAQIPGVEFSFSIAAGDAVAASATGDTMEIIPGPMTPVAPTVENAVFTSGMSTNAGTPTDATDTAHVYATDSVVVDFTGVEFTKPGVYRYVITEQANTLKGITNDPDATRYLDVFVIYDEGELKVQSYALRANATNIALSTGEYATDAGVKSSGYTNTMTSYDIEFTKAISGNQGDKNKRFKFTLAITDANPGLYTVQVSSADVIGTDSNVTANEGVYTVEVPAGSTGVTAYFYLADGDTVKVLDLPEGYGYTLTEDPEDYTSTSSDVTGYTDATTGSNISADVNTSYTNTRSGIIPTGVIITIAPFAIGLLVFGAIIVFVVSKRRRGAY